MSFTSEYQTKLDAIQKNIETLQIQLKRINKEMQNSLLLSAKYKQESKTYYKKGITTLFTNTNQKKHDIIKKLYSVKSNMKTLESEKRQVELMILSDQKLKAELLHSYAVSEYTTTDSEFEPLIQKLFDLTMEKQQKINARINTKTLGFRILNFFSFGRKMKKAEKFNSQLEQKINLLETEITAVDAQLDLTFNRRDIFQNQKSFYQQQLNQCNAEITEFSTSQMGQLNIQSATTSDSDSISLSSVLTIDNTSDVFDSRRTSIATVNELIPETEPVLSAVLV